MYNYNSVPRSDIGKKHIARCCELCQWFIPCQSGRWQKKSQRPISPSRIWAGNKSHRPDSDLTSSFHLTDDMCRNSLYSASIEPCQAEVDENS